MFEKTHNIPRAVVAHPAEDGQAVARAVHWTLGKAQELGGQPLVYAPTQRNLEYEPLVAQLARATKSATWRTLHRVPWRGGPVLAAWPDSKHLAEIDDDRRTTALCVLSWAPTDIAGWMSAHQPERLSPGAKRPKPASIDDAVVEKGMQTLTRLVNHNNELYSSDDRDTAVATLTTLRRGGHRFDPEQLYAWALANGWGPRGAQRLREVAADLNAGKRLRQARQVLREDILDRWREEARGHGEL